jgi:hypothetical protein
VLLTFEHQVTEVALHMNDVQAPRTAALELTLLLQTLR